jgi:TolB protein
MAHRKQSKHFVHPFQQSVKIMRKLLAFLLFSLATANAQSSNIGVFNTAADLGKPKLAGSASYDSTTQTYSVKGGGYNIWFNRDEFQYLYSKIKGDFLLTANFEFIGSGKDPHRKVGFMVRAGAEADNAHASATLHGDGLTVLQWRETAGANMRDPQDQIVFPKKQAQIVQLQRNGNKMTMRVANPGEPLQLVGSHEMQNLPNEALAGIFICSHDPEVVEAAKAWNVRIDQPVPDDYKGSESALGCRLEIVDVATGMRRVIHEDAKKFEAPNWMPDGKQLLINAGGSLFKIPVEGGELVKLGTGACNRLNNDHGISFDGKLLAISHHVSGKPGGGSTVYVLPLAGGTPKQITQDTPSYWHGWAPNNEEVVLVGQRNGASIYNIYKASISDGKETALTHFTSGHVDGPEYSPDGKYIYYNGNQSGTMQIWRMKPDGSEREQLTSDKNQNWFPHISPDGKQLVYISFPPEIDSDAHPSYKRVTLNLLPLAAGGEPRAIAYLYGGQGTINVPSWSPDSTQVAFVSNSSR